MKREWEKNNIKNTKLCAPGDEDIYSKLNWLCFQNLLKLSYFLSLSGVGPQTVLEDST